MKIKKINNIIFYIGIAVSVIIGLIFYINQNSENITPYVNMLVLWSYILLAIAAALTLIPTLYFMITNTRKLLKAGIVIGVFVLIIGISYLLGTGDNYEKFSKISSVEESKMVSATIYTFYILGGLALLSLVFSFIRKKLR